MRFELNLKYINNLKPLPRNVLPNWRAGTATQFLLGSQRPKIVQKFQHGSTGRSGAGAAHHATSYARFLQCNNQGAAL
jgi:hypothetical protein